jgi:hypothetical protein
MVAAPEMDRFSNPRWMSKIPDSVAPPELPPEQTPTGCRERAERTAIGRGARISHPENETENPNSGMLPQIASETFEM